MMILRYSGNMKQKYADCLAGRWIVPLKKEYKWMPAIIISYYRSICRNYGLLLSSTGYENSVNAAFLSRPICDAGASNFGLDYGAFCHNISPYIMYICRISGNSFYFYCL